MTAIDFLESKRISRKLIMKHRHQWKHYGDKWKYFHHNLKEIDRLSKKAREWTYNKLIRLCDELGIETSIEEIKKYF